MAGHMKTRTGSHIESAWQTKARPIRTKINFLCKRRLCLLFRHNATNLLRCLRTPTVTVTVGDIWMTIESKQWSTVIIITNGCTMLEFHNFPDIRREEEKYGILPRLSYAQRVHPIMTVSICILQFHGAMNSNRNHVGAVVHRNRWFIESPQWETLSRREGLQAKRARILASSALSMPHTSTGLR